MQELYCQFRFTGDPWVDAGILGFWDYIEDKGEIASRFNVTLEPKNHSISAQDSQQIGGFLKEIVDEIKNNSYIQQSDNRICVYSKAKDDFQIVNKINLVNIVAKLYNAGTGALKPLPEGKCQLSEVKFQQWEKLREKYKGQGVDFKIDRGRVYCSPPRYKWPFKPILTPKKQTTCAFCGATNACSKIHSNNYPFLVPTGNWSNFYSNLSLELQMCSLCEIASLFAVNKIFFNINWGRKRLFMAIPHASSLPEIKEFWNDVKGLDKLRGVKMLTQPSNIFQENEGYKYAYLNETTLAFAYKLYIALEATTEADRLLKMASTKTWHFFLGDTSGNPISFRNYALLDNMHRLFELFSKVGDVGIEFSQMFSNLSIKEGEDYSNLYREALSEKIIKNASINEIADKVMWKKGQKIGGFSKFVKIYNLFKEAEHVE
jgi:hypothetical protein